MGLHTSSPKHMFAAASNQVLGQGEFATYTHTHTHTHTHTRTHTLTLHSYAMDATAQANGGALLPRHSTRARRDSHYIIEQREGQ